MGFYYYYFYLSRRCGCVSACLFKVEYLIDYRLIAVHVSLGITITFVNAWGLESSGAGSAWDARWRRQDMAELKRPQFEDRGIATRRMIFSWCLACLIWCTVFWTSAVKAWDECMYLEWWHYARVIYSTTPRSDLKSAPQPDQAI